MTDHAGSTGAARRYTMVDCAKQVCADCAGHGFPNDPMPLAGPNAAANYVHVRRYADPGAAAKHVLRAGRYEDGCGFGHQVTLCAASSIWCLMRWEDGPEEVAAMSPRGWREDIPSGKVCPGPTRSA